MEGIKQQLSLLSLLGQTLPQEDSEREWYFGFCQAIDSRTPWWQKLAMHDHPKHLQHVYAFTQVGPHVLFVEPDRTRIEFVVKHPTENLPVMRADALARELTEVGHTVVRHKYVPNISGKKSIWNWIPSCVTVVKVATGFGSLATTPKGYLHDLIANGGYLFLKGDSNGRDNRK